MGCQNKTVNSDFCTCSDSSCLRRGVCCECLRYHLPKGELPGCLFSPEAEATYNRSIAYYLSVGKKK